MGKGRASDRAPNRNPGREEAVCLKASRWAGACGGAAGQAYVRKNRDKHGGIFDGGDERQLTAAVRTGGEVDGEDACESLGPPSAGACGSCGGLAVSIWGGQGRVGCTRHDLRPQRRVGGQHVMEANEMDPGTTILRSVGRNPVRAGLAGTAEGYCWSSAAAHDH